MKKFKKAAKKGFTLIELLVVIAIIGILATILIINVANARQKASNTKVKNDITEASRAASACIADGGTVSAATTSTTASGGGNVICSTTTVSNNWPTFSGGSGVASSVWSYSTTAGDQLGGTSSFTATVGDGTSYGNKGSDYSVCTATGCTFTGTTAPGFN